MEERRGPAARAGLRRGCQYPEGASLRWRRGRRYAAIVRILVRRGLRRYLRPGVRTAGDDARTARFGSDTILALLGKIEATQDKMSGIMESVVRPRGGQL